jgi:hypothetical protein
MGFILCTAKDMPIGTLNLKIYYLVDSLLLNWQILALRALLKEKMGQEFYIPN